jgi:hypothetical protein
MMMITELQSGDAGFGREKCDESTKAQFKTDLFQEYGLKNSDDPNLLWCPILGTWVPAQSMRAVHIFPCMHGQHKMDSVFGKTDPPELNTLFNGLMVAECIAAEIDTGKLVIVPDGLDFHCPFQVDRS